MEYPIILIIVYGIVTCIRRSRVQNEYLPLFACGIGALLGLIGFLLFPTRMLAPDFGRAMLEGAVSGLAATGSHQVFKQAVRLFCQKYNVDYDKLNPVVTEVDKALSGALEGKGPNEEPADQKEATEDVAPAEPSASMESTAISRALVNRR